jgi:DNA-binding MarR family transcriptional regulator
LTSGQVPDHEHGAETTLGEDGRGRRAEHPRGPADDYRILVEGMTYPRMRLIHEIAEDGPQIMAELRDRLGVSARNVTVLVDGLEKEGFARRVPHSTDRRATIIQLTDKGREVHHAVYAAHADRTQALFAALSDRDQRHLRRILARLADALVEASTAEGRLLDLDPSTFRGRPD